MGRGERSLKVLTGSAGESSHRENLPVLDVNPEIILPIVQNIRHPSACPPTHTGMHASSCFSFKVWLGQEFHSYKSFPL